MKNLFLLFTSAMFIVACSSAPKVHPLIQSLLWLEHSNPVDDAQVALRQDDTRLLALSNRSGLSIPGVQRQDRYYYENKCGVRLIEGVTDFAVNEQHRELMQQAASYALQYNAVIKTQCSKPS